jgi:hypothetical protein
MDKSAATGKPADVATELQQAEHEYARNKAMREEARFRDKVLLRGVYSDAVKSSNPFNILDVNPIRVQTWNNKKPLSLAQQKYLKHKGVNIAGLEYTHARQLIKEIQERQKQGVCTFKQAQCLRKAGIDSSSISFKDAGEMITKLANNRWKCPPEWKALKSFIGRK